MCYLFGKKRWPAVVTIVMILLLCMVMTDGGLVKRVYLSVRHSPWFRGAVLHLQDPGGNGANRYGVATGLRVHTGEYVRETQTTYLSYENDQAQIELSATWRMRSDFPQTETFALAILVDYTQVPIIINNIPQPMHIVRAESNEPLEIDFSFTVPNQRGKHQICLVLFQGIDTHRLDEDFRYGQGLVVTHISDVVVGGDDTPPEVNYQAASHVRPDDPDYDIDGININRDLHNYRQSWVTETIRPGKVLDYFIHLSNESDQDKPYVLVAWLDWQQIPLGEGESPAFFGEIKSGEQQVVTATVTVPTIEKIHELQVLYIKYPHYPAVPGDISAHTEKHPSYFVRSSLRVALVSDE